MTIHRISDEPVQRFRPRDAVQPSQAEARIVQPLAKVTAGAPVCVDSAATDAATVRALELFFGSLA